MLIHFTKMHGLSNDFMVINGVDQSIELTSEKICQLANRHTGVGFDQLLLIEVAKTKNADFFYRIFNANGSEVTQCGNGARCVAQFLQDEKNINKKKVRVETLAGVLELQLQKDGLITVNMGIPTFVPEKIPFIAGKPALTYPLQVMGHVLKVFPLAIGNPHGVLIVPDIKQAHVADLGPLLTRHSRFPEEVNVGFMQVINRHEIKLRVYERGAGETQACGSGACAAAVAGQMLGLLDKEVTVNLLGGALQIVWQGEGESVYLTGPAVTVFKGEIDI